MEDSPHLYWFSIIRPWSLKLFNWFVLDEYKINFVLMQNRSPHPTWTPHYKSSFGTGLVDYLVTCQVEKLFELIIKLNFVWGHPISIWNFLVIVKLLNRFLKLKLLQNWIFFLAYSLLEEKIQEARKEQYLSKIFFSFEKWFLQVKKMMLLNYFGHPLEILNDFILKISKASTIISFFGLEKTLLKTPLKNVPWTGTLEV